MKKTQAMIANLCLSNKPVISSRVLCDVQRTRNNVRAADSLSDKGNLCDYVDRAYVICFVSILF